MSELANTMRQQPKIPTFSSCTYKFTGERNSILVEDFIARINAYKESEKISDEHALLSLPLLLEGYTSSWWQGIRNEARTFEDALYLLRSAFAPPKPDWRIFNEISNEKQKINESADEFICRKRQLFAQLSERLSEKVMIDMIFAQIHI